MQPGQIRQVRSFNRIVSRRIGALEESYLGLGRPLSEARLIFEIGAEGAELAELRRRQGLDSGYLSRLLRSLEAQALAVVGPGAADRRARRVGLTGRGLAELSRYDVLSDELAESILAPLDEAQRERLAAAMAEVDRLLRASLVELRIEAPSGRDARRCLHCYYAELADRFERGFDPAASNPARDEDLIPPAGCFVVARLDGEAIGCGALRRTGAASGEIKRMWVDPAARGLGVARRLLGALEAEASGLGLRTLRLETNRTLHEARSLYLSAGFREVEPFNDEPYAHHWFEKDIGA